MTRRPRFEVYPVNLAWEFDWDESRRVKVVKPATREWRWRLRAANGRILASGEGFATRRNAYRAVRKLIEVVGDYQWAIEIREVAA